MLNIKTLSAGLIGFVLAAPLSAAEKTTYWGPVVLSEGKRFEVCANNAFGTFETDARLSFLRVRNGRSKSTEIRLGSGEGGCRAVSFEQAGTQPIFAVLNAVAEPGDEDLVGSAAVVNGIFNVPKRRDLVDDRGQFTLTSFGPVRLNPDKRLEVCVNNPMNFIQISGVYTVPVSIEFYRTSNSSEPFKVESGELAPGRGACVSVSEAEVGAASFFAEVWTSPVEPGFANPMVLSGAYIINGIFDSPIPPDDPRFFAERPQ